MESSGGDINTASAAASDNNKKHNMMASTVSASAPAVGESTPPLSSVDKEVIAPAEVSKKDGGGPPIGNKAKSANQQPSPTSVDMFDVFLAEVQAEGETGADAAFSQQLAQKELAQHNLNVSKLLAIDNPKYRENIELTNVGTRRVANLLELHEECCAEGSDPTAAASKLVNIIRQKEYLLIKLSTRLSGVTRKLAKKERDVEKLKAALQDVYDKRRAATKSDRKHIEEIGQIAATLKSMEKDLKAKEGMIEQLRGELESSKLSYHAEIAALEEVHTITIERYADDASELKAKIQELEEINAKRCQEFESDIGEDAALVAVQSILGDRQASSNTKVETSDRGSISDHARHTVCTLKAEQFRRIDAGKDVVDLNAQIDKMKLAISNMEKDIFHKNNELSEVKRIISTDDITLEPYQEGDDSVSARATRLVESLQTEKSLHQATQSVLDSLKHKVENLQRNLVKAEEELFERNVEMSGIRSLLEDNSFLLCDEASLHAVTEEEPVNKSVYDSTMQLVSDLSTERDRCEIADEKVSKLEEDIHRLNTNLDRLKNLELELGKKDVTIANLSQQLKATKDEAAEDIATLKQAADEESTRQRAEMKDLENTMKNRISQLQISHSKLREELEAKLLERDEEMEKVASALGESKAIDYKSNSSLHQHAQEVVAELTGERAGHERAQKRVNELEREIEYVKLTSRQDLERETKAPESETSEQLREYEARIEQEAEKRISETQAAHGKVCDELHEVMRSMEGRLDEVKSVLDNSIYNADAVVIEETVESQGVECSIADAAQTLISNLEAESDLNKSIHLRLQELEECVQQQKEEAKDNEINLKDLQTEKRRLEAELSAARDESKGDITSIRAAAALEHTKNESRVQELEKELCSVKKDKERSLVKEAERHQKSVMSLEASIATLENDKKVLLEEIGALKQLMAETKAATIAAEKRIARSEDKVCSLQALNSELEARYLALEKESKAALAKVQRDLQQTKSSLSNNIHILESERDDVANQIEILDESEAKSRADAEEKLRNHCKAVAELKRRIERLRSEKKSADESHRCEIESLKLSPNKALQAANAASIDAAAELDQMRSMVTNLEDSMSSLRLENEQLLDKMKGIVTAKDRTIAEAKTIAEGRRTVIGSLEQEKGKLNTTVCDLEREHKLAKARSKGELLAAQTEVEMLRSNLADAKREKEKAKQDEIDSLREEYDEKIKTLSSQLYGLHIAITGTAKAVASDKLEPAPSSSDREDHDEIVALRAQKEFAIKQLRMEMQAALDMKEQELEAMMQVNAASCKRIRSLELALEEKEGEVIDLKRALAETALTEKFFLENSAAYESDDNETLLGSPTRAGAGEYHENPQDCEVVVPLATRQSAIRGIPLPRLIVGYLVEILSLFFISVPSKAASLCMVICVASLMLLWLGACIAVLWSFLADDNGAKKIGAAIDYGNGLGLGLFNM